jgi:hypothetical protein
MPARRYARGNVHLSGSREWENKFKMMSEPTSPDVADFLDDPTKLPKKPPQIKKKNEDDDAEIE